MSGMVNSIGGGRVRNWGRWGDADELDNQLITARRRGRAARLVTVG